jgi:hypothetical protein
LSGFSSCLRALLAKFKPIDKSRIVEVQVKQDIL